MPTPTWDLALTELIYYIPGLIPVLYCLYKHKSAGFVGWIFLAAFVLLQLIGSGLILSAGENGTPSSTAVTIISIGLSPLLLAIAGILKEWTQLAGMLRTKKRKTIAILCEVIYHLAVVLAIAIFASGASEAADPGPNNNNPDGEWHTGVVLLFLLWLLLCAVFGILAHRMGITTSKALFWSILASLVFVGIRILFQVVATFNEDKGEYNPVNGSIALKVIFQFLPGAFTLVALVTGGIMSIQLVDATKAIRRTEIPMNSRGLEAGALVDHPGEWR